MAEGAHKVATIPAAAGGTTVNCVGHFAHHWVPKELSWLEP